jgi:hypothetical protein
MEEIETSDEEEDENSFKRDYRPSADGNYVFF